MLSEIAAVSVAALVVTLTPGADMALVARRSLGDGFGVAARTSFGICSGLIVHATASAVGVSAILARSATAFTVLKACGAVYLVLLGLSSFRRARRIRREPEHVRALPPARRVYLQGLLNNVLNPKPALFYLAFLPQFIGPGDPVVLMAVILVSIHIAMGIAWLLTWAWLVSHARAQFLRPRWRVTLERVTGTVLVGLGARLAAASR
jgi:threonine/homoserine/homoserine lactone efflux protein